MKPLTVLLHSLRTRLRRSAMAAVRHLSDAKAMLVASEPYQDLMRLLKALNPGKPLTFISLLVVLIPRVGDIVEWLLKFERTDAQPQLFITSLALHGCIATLLIIWFIAWSDPSHTPDGRPLKARKIAYVMVSSILLGCGIWSPWTERRRLLAEKAAAEQHVFDIRVNAAVLSRDGPPPRFEASIEHIDPSLVASKL